MSMWASSGKAATTSRVTKWKPRGWAVSSIVRWIQVIRSGP